MNGEADVSAGMGDAARAAAVAWYRVGASPRAGSGADAAEPTVPGAMAGPMAEAVGAGASALGAGEILVHPTATVYGIGAAPGPETDAEIARLKERPPGMPLIRLAADTAIVHTLDGVRWGEREERLAEAFWPGPLTLVLDDGTEEGIAVRVEAHPLTRAVLAAWGGLMTSTSLNRSGEEPVSDPGGLRRVVDSLPPSGRRIVVLDAGRLPGPPPSTVVALHGPARVLREGAIPEDRVRSCLAGAENG